MSYNLIHQLFSHKIKSLWGAHQTSLSSCTTHQEHPGPWAKAIWWLGLPLPEAGQVQTSSPTVLFMSTVGISSSSTVRGRFDWAGPACLTDPSILSKGRQTLIWTSRSEGIERSDLFSLEDGKCFRLTQAFAIWGLLMLPHLKTLWLNHSEVELGSQPVRNLEWSN